MVGVPSVSFPFGASNGNLNPHLAYGELVKLHELLENRLFLSQLEAVSRTRYFLQKERTPFGVLSFWSE